MRAKTFLISLLGLAQASLFCAFGSAQDPAVAPNLRSKNAFLVLPIFFYAPETKLALGVGAFLSFHPSGRRVDLRPSSIYFYAITTQMKQYSAQVEPEIYLGGNQYLIRGRLCLQRYPNKYWGIGSDSIDKLEEDYTPRNFFVEGSVQKKILPRADLYAGFQFLYMNFKILASDSGGEIAGHNVAGSDGGTVTGVGFILNRDSRDDIFFPRRGEYWQLSALFNSRTLGGDYNFSSFKLDLRKYLLIFNSHVLAFQAVIQAVSGRPPFMSYAALGGSGLMRGYYSGRYRDKVLAAFQAEYRRPVWKRIGLALFAGLGDVRSRFDAFGFRNLKYSAGAGLRFRASAKEATNIRLDFALGKNSTGFYITAREAF